MKPECNNRRQNQTKKGNSFQKLIKKDFLPIRKTSKNKKHIIVKRTINRRKKC